MPAADASPTVEVAGPSGDGVLSVRINRPEVLNAVDRATMEALAGVLHEATSDPDVRCIILTGAGHAFCAGADLNIGATTLDDAEARRMMDAAGRVVTILTTAPVPVIAAVNGPAAGIGASIAIACDLVIATEPSYFLLPFLSVGLHPDGGATATIAASVGRARAMRMALRRERVDAAQALRIGLIAHVCAVDELDTAAREWAADLAAGSRAAIAATKAAINVATLGGLAFTLQRESDDQRRLLGSPDFAEGAAAFRDRRRPNFAR